MMAEGRLMFRKERYGMKKKVPIKTVYYKDELQDEFSTAVITPKKIDGSSSWVVPVVIAVAAVAVVGGGCGAYFAVKKKKKK